MAAISRVVIVDDDEHIRELATLYLRKEGFEVTCAADGVSAIKKIQQVNPHLVVLDLMLPAMSGYDVCKQVRLTSNVPIIMLTARDEDVDKIVGLELGADDYLTKPFNPRELVARVKAILRRVDRPPAGAPDPIHLGDVTLDPGRREVTVAGAPISLRPKEFDLLLTLAEHRGLVLTREQLLRQAWGFDFYGETRTVDVHIGHLRKRLAPSPSVRIETVTGVGYKLVL